MIYNVPCLYKFVAKNCISINYGEGGGRVHTEVNYNYPEIKLY